MSTLRATLTFPIMSLFGKETGGTSEQRHTVSCPARGLANSRFRESHHATQAEEHGTPGARASDGGGSREAARRGAQDSTRPSRRGHGADGVPARPARVRTGGAAMGSG